MPQIIPCREALPFGVHDPRLHFLEVAIAHDPCGKTEGSADGQADNPEHENEHTPMRSDETLWLGSGRGTSSMDVFSASVARPARWLRRIGRLVRLVAWCEPMATRRSTAS